VSTLLVSRLPVSRVLVNRVLVNRVPVSRVLVSVTHLSRHTVTVLGSVTFTVSFSADFIGRFWQTVVAARPRLAPSICFEQTSAGVTAGINSLTVL